MSEKLTLADFLAAHPGEPALVPPLVHVTDGGNLPTIIAEGKLDPNKSKLVAEERAIYLSVGKPAYLLKPKDQSEFFDAPVVFVFERPAYLKLDKMFPMDSGAFSAGRYDNILGAIARGDMEIPANASSVASIIHIFFGSTENYIKSKAKTPSEVQEAFNVLPSAFRVLALAALYNSTRTNTMDDRKATIEGSTRKPLETSGGLLRGIVLPEEWLSDFAIRKPLQELGCQIETYDLYPINRSHYQSELYRLTRRISST